MTGQSSFPTRFLRNSPNRSCADGSKQSSAQRFHVAAITSLKFSHLPRLQHEGPLLALGQGSWHLTRLPDRESPKTQFLYVEPCGTQPFGSNAWRICQEHCRRQAKERFRFVLQSKAFRQAREQLQNHKEKNEKLPYLPSDFNQIIIVIHWRWCSFLFASVLGMERYLPVADLHQVACN